MAETIADDAAAGHDGEMMAVGEKRRQATHHSKTPNCKVIAHQRQEHGDTSMLRDMRFQTAA